MTAPTTRPRARFAPSPTGYFHVGSARAALFNWLFVRRHGGTFLLRIEDTDEARNRPEWTDGIIAALDWLGMAPDEGPYFQSAQEQVHRPPSRRSGAAARFTRAAAPARRSTRGRRPGRPPGIRRPGTTGIAATSACPRGRAGAALPHPRRGRGAGARPGARGCRVPAAGTRGLHLRQRQRQTALRAGQRRRRPHHGHQSCDPRRGPAPHHAAPGPAVGRAERGRGRNAWLCRPTPTCPCW